MKRFAVALALIALLPSGVLAADAPPAERGVHYVYLVRHGFYDRDDKADDRVGNGLNALGREQARLLAARLRKLPVRLDAIVTSDFTRARETADILGRSLGITSAADTLIHECGPSSMNNAASSSDEVTLCDSNLAAAWQKYMRPSPEKDRRDVLVCHGNVIRWLVSRALGDTRLWPAMDIANGSLTVIAVHPDGAARLLMFSDVGHLPPVAQTWTGRGARWGMEPAKAK